MLKIGRYPWFLRKGFWEKKGICQYSSRRDNIELVSESSKERLVLLAHLSKENNFPEMAYQTVKIF